MDELLFYPAGFIAMSARIHLYNIVQRALVTATAALLAGCTAQTVHLDDLELSADSRILAVGLWSSRPDPASFMDITDVRYWLRLYETDTWNYRDLAASERIGAMAFSSGGNLLATGHREGTIHLWDVASGRITRALTGHDEEIRSLDFSPDDRYLLSASPDGSAKVWSIPSGELLRSLQLDDWATVARFSPDGRTLATGSRDGSISVWDSADGRLLATWVAHVSTPSPGAPTPAKGVLDLAYSNDGALIASGGRDNVLAVWQAGSGELQYRQTEDPRAWVNDVAVVAFSADQKYIAAGLSKSTDIAFARSVPNGAVILYRLSDGGRERLLGGLDTGNEGLFFTPDGRSVIAGGGAWPSTATIAVWDLATGSLQKQLHPGPMQQ